jgi:deazaflavin-dependent oxidoreductase (nitroreductase family)
MTTPQFVAMRKYIPYPSFPILKYVLKSPVLLWRLGLGSIVGRRLMIMTTIGRKSGRLRHTAVEYHVYKDRKYVMAAWPQADWYRNLADNPYLTIQTASASEEVSARRLSTDEELSEVYELVEQTPVLRKFCETHGIQMTLSDFLAHKDRFSLFTFDAVYEPTVVPLDANLRWVWLLGIVSGLAGLIIHLRQRTRVTS